MSTTDTETDRQFVDTVTVPETTDTSAGADQAAPRAVPDLSVKTLGTPKVASPMAPLLESRQTTEHYVDETDRVLLDDTLNGVVARGLDVSELPGLEPCGPRRKIFFDPSKTRAAIVTCAGCAPVSTTSSPGWCAT